MVGICHLGDAGAYLDGDCARGQVWQDRDLRGWRHCDVRYSEPSRYRRLFDCHNRADGKAVATLAVAAGSGARGDRGGAGYVGGGADVGEREWRADWNSEAGHLATLENAASLIIALFAWVIVCSARALSEHRSCQQHEDGAQDTRAREAAMRQRRKQAPCGFEFHFSITVVNHDFLLPVL